MKNIHLIATDKPSRLSINTCFDNVLELWDEIDVPKINQDGCIQDYNIYITNLEKIKEGDWHFKNDKMVTKSHIIDDTCKKIILTTDQDLVGVQAIDDEFLEWFVKNPSCEEVEVEDWYNKFLSCCRSKEECYCNKKRIIIPQEEFKQEPKNTCPKCRTTDFDDCHSIKCPMRKEEPKQEMIEEFIKKSYLSRLEDYLPVDFEDGVKLGAKWMKEKMYTEEDMINFAFDTYYYISKIMGVPFNQISENKLHAIENLKQFKKK